MRISRRFSRSTAAGAATLLTALSMAACSGSSSGSGSAASSASASQSLANANANANENDVQVLNSLQLTTQELDSAFATDSQWQVWTGADASKILLKQAWACTQNIIDTSKKSLEPVTGYFRANALPSDTSSAPSSPTTSSSKNSSHKNSGAPTSGSTGSSSSSTVTVGSDGNPLHWVVSTAIAYQSADAAQAAVAGMGTVDPKAPGCGGPADGAKDEVVGGGIGEVGPSWDNSQGVFVFTDTQTHVTIAAVAQRRGRYVVITYTRGTATDTSGYYDLEAGPDTNSAADAATAVLGQLTNSVVGSGS